MIKDFYNITEKDLEYMRNHPVQIYEKLDLPYFKIEIDYGGITLLTSKNKPITDVDKVINSVYKEISEWVDLYIKDLSNDILDAFGATRLGFFYVPVHKPNHIEYSKMYTGRYILNDFYVFDKEAKDFEKLREVLRGCYADPPLIKEYDSLPEIDQYDEPIANVRKLIENSWSGNDIEDIEGIIIKSGKKSYKIIVNDVSPDIDMTTLKVYRDYVVQDFAKYVSDRNLIEHCYYDDYIRLMAELFINYINETDLLSKVYIEPEDLLPPKDGYMGDIDFRKLPSTMAIVCRNDVFKNMFRIVLVAFIPEKSADKYKEFDGESKRNILSVLNQINNKFMSTD